MTLGMIMVIVAIVGIFALVVLRLYELKSGKAILSENKLDTKLEKVGNKVSNSVSRKLNGVVEGIQNIPSAIARTPHKIKVFLYRRFQKYVDLVKGRGVLHTKGSMPVFFSQVNEHKRELRNRS